jgi:hypothetical protein
LAAGLLLGGFMQPHLYDGDRPAGPQMFAGWNGARSTGPFDDGATLANFQGPVPDYVMGTDAKKAMTWPEERAAVSKPRYELARDDDPPPEAAPVLTRAAYEEPAAPEHDYPSLGHAVSATDHAVDSSDDDAPATSA